jgi:hypothetical protein
LEFTRHLGASFLKAIPSWISQKATARIIPTIEESIFDRAKNTLITYTRNVSWRNIAKMEEKCFYVPEVSVKKE